MRKRIARRLPRTTPEEKDNLKKRVDKQPRLAACLLRG
jgi:hypothetical protein